MTTFFGSYERARNRFPLVRTNSSFVTVREGDTDTFASPPASSPAPRGNVGNNGCSGAALIIGAGCPIVRAKTILRYKRWESLGSERLGE